MKKTSIVQASKSEIFKEQKLTIGLDLGDRWSFYCVMDEAGQVILEQNPTEQKDQRSGATWTMCAGVGSCTGIRVSKNELPD
jgi:hypothetical protein